MESMEDIISPRSLGDDLMTFRSSRSCCLGNGSQGRQDILKMEMVVFEGVKASRDSRNEKHQQQLRKREEMPGCQQHSGDWQRRHSSFSNRTTGSGSVVAGQASSRGFAVGSYPSGEDNQLHIEHRKCSKRQCQLCKPTANHAHHNPQCPVDSTLFYRWEKRHDALQTPSVSLRKVKYTVNEVGQVHKEVEKKVRGRVKESAETIKSKIRVKLDTLKGHRVIARLDQDGLYYPAVVVKCPDPRHALVSYDSGSNAQVLTRNIILTGGAVARPQLQVGDYVMMRVVNLDSNDECYVPAIVQAEPQKSQAQAKFYSVIMYNGQKASTLRTFLVKISKERFELASMYIAHQHSEETQQSEDQVHVTPRHKRNRKSKKETKTPNKPPNKPPKRPPSSRQPRREVESVSEPSSSRQLSTREQRFEEESVASESPRPVSIRDQRIEEESIASDSPRPVSSREQSIIEEELEPSDNERQSSRSAERERSRSAEKESSRSAASIDGRTRELDRLLKEIKEREEKQERQMQKLKRKAKKLAKREQKLEARRYLSNEALDCDIKVLHTPSPDLSHDEGEMHSKQEENQSPSLLQLRKSLPRLRPGEEVLARWSDDGWYYRGIVKHDHGDYSYNLEDSTGLAERIWREDIISEDDSFNQVVEADSKVVALHPDYSFSYAPATVLEISETSVEVNFYDGQVSTLPRNETYLSSQAKHDMDVAYILKQERRLIGAAVVARDDRTGAFYPGSVIRRAENGVDYVVGWTDGTEVAQRSIFIFSAFTRRPPLSAGDRVLALADPVQVKFLPGFLIGSSEENLIVKFCDGEVSEAVDAASCYWLGRTYYDDAVDFYKSHDSSFY